MAYTQLSPLALPGARYSFSVKLPAEQVTDLSVSGIPGPIHSFLPKSSAVSARGEEEFTRLSVFGIPGPIQEFLAKSPAVSITVTRQKEGRFVGTLPRRYTWPPRVAKESYVDDRDLVEIVAMLLKAGIIGGGK